MHVVFALLSDRFGTQLIIAAADITHVFTCYRTALVDGCLKTLKLLGVVDTLAILYNIPISTPMATPVFLYPFPFPFPFPLPKGGKFQGYVERGSSGGKVSGDKGRALLGVTGVFPGRVVTAAWVALDLPPMASIFQGRLSVVVAPVAE